MLRNIVRRHAVTETKFSIDFDRSDGTGFSFECDSRFQPILDSECALQNYQYAKKHPEEFEVYDELVRREFTYVEEGHGTCVCGNEVHLWDQYHGACECTGCGRWYNLYGQELLKPEYWEDDEA